MSFEQGRRLTALRAAKPVALTKGAMIGGAFISELRRNFISIGFSDGTDMAKAKTS